MANPVANSGSSRDTFLSVKECLEQATARCSAAAHGVQSHLSSVGSPYREGLQEMVDKEHELAGLLSRYADRGPSKLLNTRLQFTLHLPGGQDSDTASAALKHLQAINEQVLMNLREQVSNSVPPDSLEEWDTLWRDAEAVARQISTIHVTMRDI